MEKHVDIHVGGYHLTKSIGTGGMGAVLTACLLLLLTFGVSCSESKKDEGKAEGNADNRITIEADSNPDKYITLDLAPGVTMKLAHIPAGTFMMGSKDSTEEVAKKGRAKVDWCKDEGPQRLVTITKPFYMGIYEVTQEQYQAIMGKNPSHFKGAKNPVEKVSWNDAVSFCKALSRKTGKMVRLPTEAEWEYACRAGTTTPFNTGSTISTNQANYDGDYTYGNGRKCVDRGKTISVGSFKPNAWGLYDMHGNVWEWCRDWYKVSYANANTRDPQGPNSGTYRVLRGGSWISSPRLCRSASRNWFTPGGTFFHYGFGFRVVFLDL
ncbi:MAG: formylglycine-generating enzyme family protein [Phycisphaerae bacterium]|nr:formylglycine-generating enzyme family protein [Phycisphaerae bacterium]